MERFSIVSIHSKAKLIHHSQTKLSTGMVLSGGFGEVFQGFGVVLGEAEAFCSICMSEHKLSVREVAVFRVVFEGGRAEWCVARV